MKAKKNKDVNLESKRGGWFQLGLLAAGALTLVAFEYTAWDEVETEQQQTILSAIDDEQVEEYQQPLPKRPSPPQAQINMALPPVVQPPTDPVVEPPTDPVVEPPTDPTGPFTDGPDFEPEEPEDYEPFVIVENMPHWKTEKKMKKDKLQEFTEEQFYKFLSKNIKYPDMCRDAGIEGKVYISFVIGEDGEVTEVKTLNSVHPQLDSEAIRVISQLPAYEPGKQRGRPVKVRLTVPINFKLK